MSEWPKCSGCGQAPAVYELLQPLREPVPFPKPEYACEQGAATGWPKHLLRRLTPEALGFAKPAPTPRAEPRVADPVRLRAPRGSAGGAGRRRRNAAKAAS